MKKEKISFGIVCILICTLIFSGCVTPDEPTEPLPQTEEDIAHSMIDFFNNSNFTTAYTTLFDETMKTQTTPEQLEYIWNQIISTYGDFTGIQSIRTAVEQGYTIVYVTCQYDKLGFLDTRVVFDGTKKIAGFQFVPTDVSDQYEPPSYVNQELFTEIEVVVGQGTLWELPGTLALPQGEGPFPAVVLVHGSGPNDRDETVGPNKPFKDIALGLATQGIAVLRYEKRTRHHASTIVNMLTNFTVDDETIDDAHAAVALLMEQETIDDDRIYLLGHSLGGLLAPRIAQNNTHLAGLLMLAAPTRSLLDLLVYQTQYLALLDGTIDEAEQAQIDGLSENVSLIRSQALNSDEIILGACAGYWYDLEAYDPVASAQTLDIPLLILQGERDYQVTFVDDFSVWQEIFAGADQVSLISYSLLNHLFIAGEGIPNNMEYLEPGNVDEQVISDITTWIQH